MAGNLLLGYGTNGQSMTITLASLAASATVGRAGTAIDNTTNKYKDYLCTIFFETGTVAGNKQILVFGYGTTNGGTNYDEGITGTDASFTRQDPTGLPLKVFPAVASAKAYSYTFSVAQLFGGSIPDHWGLLVCNDSGAALSATAGNNKVNYQGVYETYT